MTTPTRDQIISTLCENEAHGIAADAILALFEPLTARVVELEALVVQNNPTVFEEMTKALKKFPEWPTDPLHALAVLGEEFGELTKDVLQMCYEPHKTCIANVRMEAIQTAAMALRFLTSLESDKYIFGQGVQHFQVSEKSHD